MNQPQRKILVAEDSPTQAEHVAAVLTDGGYTVAIARDGAQALARLAEEPFDALVSDIVMPEVDGFQLCARVKDAPTTIPVVLMTSVQDPLDVVRALETGADAFVRKPFTAEALLSRLDSLFDNLVLRSRSERPGVELSFQDRRYVITADRQQLLDLLISSFEDLVATNDDLRERERELAGIHRLLSEQLRLTTHERERLQTLLSSVPLPVLDTDAHMLVNDANPAALSMLALPRDEIVGRPLSHVLRLETPELGPDEVIDHLRSVAERGELAEYGAGFDLRAAVADGQTLSVHVRAAPVLNQQGVLSSVVVMVNDLGGLALHDAATGLPGHVLFANALRGALESDERDEVAVMLLRFDRLPGVREHLDAEAASVLLGELGARLRTLAGASAIVDQGRDSLPCHLGGTDFALLVTGVRSATVAREVGRVVVDESNRPLRVGALDIVLPAAVGVALSEPGSQPATLVQAARQAAAVASRRGGGRVEVARATDTVAVRRLELEAELRHAITAGELTLHYQPIVDLLSRRINSVEALVRWQHPSRGLVPPGDFIPLAEETGLIRPLGSWVVREAAEQLHAWNGVGETELRVSINVGVLQLADASFVDEVESALRSSEVDPARITLEITETAIVSEDEVVGETLARLRTLGLAIAIDDFGTGHSSLRYLRKFPVDVVKIDRSFVASMEEGTGSAAIVAGIVRLAHALGIAVVAEGVETEDQLVRLRAIGCDHGQGFLWSRPVPAGAIPELVAAWTPRHGPASAGLNGAGSVDDVATEEEADDVLAYLAHELRSPAAALSGFAELLEDHLADADPQARRLLFSLQRSARSLSAVISSMSDARDVNRGTLTVDLEPVDVRALVMDVVEDLSRTLEDHRLELAMEDAVVCRADRSRVAQALRNLLTNAAKYTPDGTLVEVSVSSTGDDGEIVVRDHGPGIPEERRPMLFRKFARVNPERGGMGIGLFLSRAIARAHGGDLWYEPAPDGGACFMLRLPLAVDADAGQDSKR